MRSQHITTRFTTVKSGATNIKVVVLPACKRSQENFLCPHILFTMWYNW